MLSEIDIDIQDLNNKQLVGLRFESTCRKSIADKVGSTKVASHSDPESPGKLAS